MDNTEQGNELQRLAGLVKRTFRRDERNLRMADLLAFLGVIHDTPNAKREWIDQVPIA